MARDGWWFGREGGIETVSGTCRRDGCVTGCFTVIKVILRGFLMVLLFYTSEHGLGRANVDNGLAGTPAGVQEDLGRWVPVVSLRSTTGYRLASLRDEA